MNKAVDKISEVMHSVYGMDISMYDDTFLCKAVEKRYALAEVKTIADYMVYLSGSQTEAEDLFRSLNITYTEFFRNPLTFAHLEQWILPQLMEGKSDNSELRIWSAGCSSGQEPYSVAILLERLRFNKQKTLRYRIIATDISESALVSARKGEYDQEAIQNIRVKDLNEYFVKSGEQYTVCSHVKKHVGFTTYNLLDNLSSCPQESIFGNFDLVICNNILFYYKPEYQHFILKKLINSMSEHGYLITGEVERHAVAKVGGLRSVAPPITNFSEKSGGLK